MLRAQNLFFLPVRTSPLLLLLLLFSCMLLRIEWRGLHLICCRHDFSSSDSISEYVLTE